MRKHRKSATKLLLASIVLTATMGLTTYAADWKQDNGQWQYEQDGGGYATGWNWIDGKCYYFDSNGYMAANTEIDGYTLNADGQWAVNGIVQTQENTTSTNQTVDNTQGQTLQFNPDDDIRTRNVTPVPVRGGEVIDGKSVLQIIPNQELIGLFRTADGISNFPVSFGTMIGASGNTDIYSVSYNNTILKVMVHREINQITGYLGETKILLNNIPTQGIELNAFYDNTGFKDANNGRKYVASTGNSDQLFGLQTGTYRMTQFSVGNYVASIVLTLGYDGNWYIYPDNQMFFN